MTAWDFLDKNGTDIICLLVVAFIVWCNRP